MWISPHAVLAWTDTLAGCLCACLQERLSQRFPGVQFTVEAKADATYPIVSAGKGGRAVSARVARLVGDAMQS